MNGLDRPRVGLVTIWYRAGSAIDRFAAELRAVRYPNLLPVFVINALQPNEVGRLRSAVPEAHIVEPGSNLGPAAGWNLAIERALAEGVDIVGMWNVDTHFDPECIPTLVELLDRSPDVGACQPILCDFGAPNRVQMFGGTLDLATGLASHDFKGAEEYARLPALRDADYLDGGSMFIRAEVLRTVGGFDERLFMYAEDCDLSLRIRRAGYRTVAVRDARAWHEYREGKGYLPPPHEVFYRTRNRFFLVRKYAPRRAWRRAVARALVWEVPRSGLFYLRRSRPDLARAHTGGVICGVTGHFGKQGWVD